MKAGRVAGSVEKWPEVGGAGGGNSEMVLLELLRCGVCVCVCLEGKKRQKVGSRCGQGGRKVGRNL